MSDSTLDLLHFIHENTTYFQKKIRVRRDNTEMYVYSVAYFIYVLIHKIEPFIRGLKFHKHRPANI